MGTAKASTPTPELAAFQPRELGDRRGAGMQRREAAGKETIFGEAVIAQDCGRGGVDLALSSGRFVVEASECNTCCTSSSP